MFLRASVAESIFSFPVKKLWKKSAICGPNIINSAGRADSAVCHDSSDFITCRHTGVADFPAAVSNWYSLRACASASVKIGRLLDMARKNICGPMASEGSSRTICCMDIPSMLNCVRPAMPNRCMEACAASSFCCSSDICLRMPSPCVPVRCASDRRIYSLVSNATLACMDVMLSPAMSICAASRFRACSCCRMESVICS